MTIRFDRLLTQWYPRRDECEWVLGTIIETQRSTYRKAGAMIFISGLGESLGMLSGGCVEGDLRREARKAMFAQQSRIVEYEMREDSDSPWQAQLGCGGYMRVLLQPISAKNDYLGLVHIHQALNVGKAITYQQRIDTKADKSVEDEWRVQSDLASDKLSALPSPKSTVLRTEEGHWLNTPIKPSPHLLIIGGGLDAQPLAMLAHNIGWKVSVADPRAGQALTQDFPHADTIHAEIDDLHITPDPNAVVIMSHNITLDAHALRYALNIQPRYVGLLGPTHRRQKVEALANCHQTDFKHFYCGPVGLDMGASLPETIALSILAQCHHVLEGNFDQVANTITSRTGSHP